MPRNRDAARDAGFDNFFRFVGGGIMALATVGGAAALSHGAAKKACLASIRSVVAHLERASDGIEALAAAEAEVRSTANKIGVDWPPGLTEDAGSFLARTDDSVLLHARGFRRQIASALQQARQDLSNLTAAGELFDKTRLQFRQAAAAANRSDAVTLIHELEGMHDAMVSESMMSLLTERRWDDFAEINMEMVKDLVRIERQASRYQASDAEPSQQRSNDTEYSRACQILGVSEQMTAAEIKRKYRELVRNYHPDRSSQATAAVRALAEERFKQIQQAWEIIEAAQAA